MEKSGLEKKKREEGREGKDCLQDNARCPEANGTETNPFHVRKSWPYKALGSVCDPQ